MATTITIGSVSGLPGPAGPTGLPDLPRFVTGQTQDGTRIAYQYTAVKVTQWTLDLTDLTTAQMAALQNYFDDTAKGPTNTFTYIHTDGSSYASCRFIDTHLTWTRVSDEQWNVTVRIERQARIQS